MGGHCRADRTGLSAVIGLAVTRDAYYRSSEVRLKRRLGILLIAGGLVWGGLFSWQTVVASLYSNLAARALSRALLAQPVERQALVQSVDLARRALAVRRGYIPAQRLIDPDKRTPYEPRLFRLSENQIIF